MFKYPKILRKKDLKKISKYSCDEKIKDAYLKYLTPYSFEEFAQYCNENSEEDLDDLVFNFTDLQLEKFEPNSLIWVSHVMINFMIYFNVNFDYGYYYDAYASALQLTVLLFSMRMMIDKLTFDDIELPAYSKECFKSFFTEVSDFNFNLKNDCSLAYKSFNNDFAFSDEEFYLKVKDYFDEMGWEN